MVLDLVPQTLRQSLMTVRRLLLLAVLCFTGVCASAQTTKVRGQVLEEGTGEPMAFVAIFFEGTSIGVSTDEEGRYYVETRDSLASVLTAQMLGYISESHEVPFGVFSEIDFTLRIDADQLTAARIVPDDSYVNHILDELDRHRELNDPYLAEDPWSMKVYSKVELDATHAEWLATKTFLRKLLGGVVKWRDTSAVTGQSYIPIMISETFSRKYHGNEPPLDKEEIVANKISGVDSDNFLRQYSGAYLLKTNFYDVTIPLFNLELPSPAAAFGRAFYNYYLVDSLEMDSRKSYCLRFHPKNGVTSPCFDGELYIDAEDFGIRSAHVALAKRSNVNWIRHINIDTESRRSESGRWFPKEEKLFIDFSIAVSDSSKVISFLGNRELHYGEPEDVAPSQGILDSPDAVVVSTVTELDERQWQDMRPVPLTAREQGISEMIEGIKQKPEWKTWYTIARSLVVGYVEGERTKVSYGPWAQTVTYNATEGWHVGLGLRTTKFFNPRLRLKAGVGYGFRDHLIKGNASVEYMFRRDRTRKLTVAGRYGYTQLGQGSAVLTQPNMFNTLLSSRGGDKQTLLRDISLEYEHEFTHVFSGYFTALSRRLYGNAAVPLATASGTHLKSISANQIGFSGRIAWDERINRGFFDKAHLLTRYPVLGFSLSGGIPGVTADDYGFLRGELSFDWRIPAGMLGFGSVHMDGGAIFGEVPYPFLKLHEGNMSYFLDKTAFTCMDYYEFASDRWATLMYEHNLNGLILGHIPLIKRLDLREIISFKAAVGTMSGANRSGAGLMPMEGLSTLEKPYAEVGVGLSNILRVLRVDATWRLTHRAPDSRNFWLTAGFDVQF